MAKVRYAIGLMSGTSLDGIDAALIETDGRRVVRPGLVRHLAYSAGFRAELRDGLDFARAHPSPARIATDLAETARRLSVLHAEVVFDLLADVKCPADKIAVVGFHGQTVLHRPDEGVTVQIGEGVWLAGELGIPVVDQFRAADVAAGGQGAPLAPAYHRALAAALPRDMAGPVAVVNIGGVSNVTFVDGEADPIAFDTGPGNALLDDWVRDKTGKFYDQDGALARLGKVDDTALAALITSGYLAKSPPKSLDRNDFSPYPVAKLSPQDGAATLTAFTAEVIAMASRHFPKTPDLWIVCGGGRHNPVLMEELARRSPQKVISAEDVGWRGDDIEAEAFAYLAVRSLDDLPLTWPSTTGVPRPMPGGILHQP
ncbi:Anhydro-N-acetylmuramic acid kinase [hydrothermal vent metagenome]|uniref:Anhydro-N-acetylmuramic acid kinase n=1 Tax=hydrothermal vent metagenome TaxID=652676 RepID=A0A3B0TIG3_9ZZZZ